MGGRVIFKVLMVKTTTIHKHPRHVRYPAQLSATAGYVLLVTAWLLILGMAGVVTVEAAWTLLPVSSTANYETVWMTIGGLSSSSGTSEDLSIGAKAILLFVLLLIVSLMSHFVAVHASQFMHWFIQKLGLKLTSTHLFIMKCLLALLVPFMMMVAVLGLPNIAAPLGQLIVGFSALLAVASVVCFSVQHVIARRVKMAVKNIL